LYPLEGIKGVILQVRPIGRTQQLREALKIALRENARFKKQALKPVEIATVGSESTLENKDIFKVKRFLWRKKLLIHPILCNDEVFSFGW